ncbi:hypothetical protein HNQ51_001846 [Inhella inkyongensis]|uniref:SPOR domain-containing protein n=1 Tax=Inhella inkyongensis TaxID=392593 RepID=A0A840S4P5_9BURK|nr:hypothetical protein [Inhella inkyongensis]MBB5204532.1 hypothetical protein [Inhella inkyongensis]
MSLTPAAIQEAVRAWHNRHPLAVRIGPEAVHSMGWVSLPFMGPAQAVEPSLDAATQAATPTSPTAAPWKDKLAGWIRRPQSLLRRTAGPWPVFSEEFVEGLKARRVAAFALRCAWTGLDERLAEWPQRQVAVDSALAEACSGAWPLERWLVAAAIDVRGQRLRVLVGEGPRGLEVLAARRHLARPLVLGLAASALSLAAVALWVSLAAQPTPKSQAEPAPAAASAAPSAVVPQALPGSAPSAATPPTTGPSAPNHAPVASAAAPAAPPSSAASAASSPPAAESPASSTAPPDIRPRLGPTRPSTARSPKAVLQGKPGAAESRTEPASAAASRPYRGAQDPENLRPRAAPQGPQVALVSPGYAKRSEAEAQLERMRAHVAATTRDAHILEGEVFETPLGWRAAVWPFGTREEAQIVNATMVARGWKTRAIDF